MLGSVGFQSVNAQAKRVVLSDQVDPAGGDVTIVTLNDSSTVRQVKVGGVNCSFFTVSSTKIGVITPPLSAGTKTLQVKFNSGASAKSTITYWSPIDANTTLCLERGDYVGDTWKDRSDNGNDFDDATYHPEETVREPQFDGIDRTLTGSTNSVTPSTTLGTTTDPGDTYSVTIAFFARTLAAPDVSTSQSTAIIADHGAYIGAHLTSSWLRWYHYQVSELYVDLGAVTANEWHVLQVKCDDGSLTARIDGGAWTSPVVVGGLGALGSYWRIASNVYGDHADIDTRVILIDNVARSDSHFDNVLEWVRTRHGIKTSADPEIDVVDSDVFDPNGGDVMRVRGRNLTGLSDVRIGSSAHVVSPAIASHASFDGTNDKLGLSVALTSLLGGSGWTFSALVDCRDLVADAGQYVNQTLFSETDYCVGLEIFRGGARLWQFNAAGAVVYTATAGGIGNGLHLIQAKWTGTEIAIRVDSGPWVSTALSEIGGTGTFRIGSDYTGTAYFLKGRIVEMFFSDSALSDGTLDSVAAGINFTYGLKLGWVEPTPYDVTTLSLSAYFKPGDYTSGTWSGTASAGNSSGRDLSEVTNPPSVVTTSALGIKTIIGAPDFDGVNDTLKTGAVTAGDLFGTGNHSGWILFYADKIVGSAGAGSRYTNDVIFSTASAGYWTLTIDTFGLASLRFYDSTTAVYEMNVNIDGGWNLFQWRYDGTYYYVRTNGADWTITTTAGFDTPGGTSETMSLGSTPALSSNQLNGQMAEIACSTTDIGTNGCDDVLAYVNQTYGLALGGRAPYDFDPTTLSLSLYCKVGNYSAGTWTGTASAGSSSGRDLTELTNYPSTAADEATCRVPAISAGMTTAAVPYFDGADDLLGGTGQTSISPETAFGMSGGESSAGSYVVLFRASTAFASGGAEVYQNPGLLMQMGGNAAGNGCSYSDAGVKVGHYDGFTWDTLTLAADVGEWHVVQVKWDGATLYARVLTHDRPAGAWQSTLQGPYSTTSGGLMALGIDYSSARWFKGTIADVMMADSTLSDSDMDNIVRYLNQRYSLSLGQYSSSAYNPSVLSLTAWWKSGNYSAGTWTGAASAGGSGAVNIAHDTSANQPLAVTEVVPSLYSVSVVTPVGANSLTKAIRYANPGTMPGNVFWVRGDLGVTSDSSGKASGWADQSTVGDANRDLAQGTGANRPAIVGLSQINGKKALEFDGSNTWLTSSAWSAPAPYASPMSFHSFFRHDSLASSPYIFDDLDGGNRVAWLFASVAQLYAGNNGLTAWTPGLGSKYSAVFDYVSSTVANLYPTRDDVVNVGANPGTNSLYNMTVGSRYNNIGVLDGILAELTAFDHELTATERRILRRYNDSFFGKTML